MTPEQLFRAIGAVDEERLASVSDFTDPLVQDSDSDTTSDIAAGSSKIRRIPFRQLATIAACACILLICVSVPNMFRMGKSASTADTASYEADMYKEASEETDEGAAEEAIAYDMMEAEEDADTTAEAPAEEAAEGSSDIEESEAKSLNQTKDRIYNDSYASIRINQTTYYLLSEDTLSLFDLTPDMLFALTMESTSDITKVILDTFGREITGSVAISYEPNTHDQPWYIVKFADDTIALYSPEKQQH